MWAKEILREKVKEGHSQNDTDRKNVSKRFNKTKNNKSKVKSGGKRRNLKQQKNESSKKHNKNQQRQQ